MQIRRHQSSFNYAGRTVCSPCTYVSVGESGGLVDAPHHLGPGAGDVPTQLEVLADRVRAVRPQRVLDQRQHLEATKFVSWDSFEKSSSHTERDPRRVAITLCDPQLQRKFALVWPWHRRMWAQIKAMQNRIANRVRCGQALTMQTPEGHSVRRYAQNTSSRTPSGFF